MKIRVYTDIQDMQGIGEEWLLTSNGETVLAILQDGWLTPSVQSVGDSEPTKGVTI